MFSRDEIRQKAGILLISSSPEICKLALQGIC